MKLKPDFMTHEIDGTQFLIPLGGEAFSGVIRSNETAAFIVDALADDVTEEQLVERMLKEYNASREDAEEDVRSVLATLRSVGALEE